MRKIMRRLHLPTKIKSPLFDSSLQQFLTGRIWLESQLPFLKQTILYHKTQQFITSEVGIQSQRCRRCMSEKLHYFRCSKCKGPCSYCIDCLQMGRVSQCSPLLKWQGPKPIVTMDMARMTWSGNLTDAQRRVAKDCIQGTTDHLIHAVTGAGKTEILFPIIEHALHRNLRVCIATPRTDVVLELFPRLQQAFQQANVQAFYGGSGHAKAYSPLIVATTHQLIRFENAFDVIFVDEADAFPYTYDEKLKAAVKKAKKRNARVLLVTATPTKKERQQFEKLGSYSFLSRRFHGADLPVPKYKGLWGYERQFRRGRIPSKLKIWVQNCLQQNKPILLFFPTIELMETALPLFQQLNGEFQAVHASDIGRKEKVQQLRDRGIPGLLTTTILERGITIPNVQVAVIGAESKIFNASALIQISGRVGRSKGASSGDVLFFHHGITWQMDEACSEIIRLNRQVMSK